MVLSLYACLSLRETLIMYETVFSDDRPSWNLGIMSIWPHFFPKQNTYHTVFFFFYLSFFRMGIKQEMTTIACGHRLVSQSQLLQDLFDKEKINKQWVILNTKQNHSCEQQGSVGPWSPPRSPTKSDPRTPFSSELIYSGDFSGIRDSNTPNKRMKSLFF